MSEKMDIRYNLEKWGFGCDRELNQSFRPVAIDHSLIYEGRVSNYWIFNKFSPSTGIEFNRGLRLSSQIANEDRNKKSAVST